MVQKRSKTYIGKIQGGFVEKPCSEIGSPEYVLPSVLAFLIFALAYDTYQNILYGLFSSLLIAVVAYGSLFVLKYQIVAPFVLRNPAFAYIFSPLSNLCVLDDIFRKEFIDMLHEKK